MLSSSCRRVSSSALLLSAAALALTGCSSSSTAGSAPTSASSATSAPPAGSAASATGSSQCTYTATGDAARKVALPKTTGVPETGTAVFEMTTNDGDITITSDRAKTPCTINSFASLVAQKFYDNTRCHRLVDSGIFVLQCGDPTATGSGGPGYSFPDELSGSETYPAGTVAMANSGPNTNGSQFFLVYANSPLPASYTVFGRLDQASLAVVDKIKAAGEDGSNGPGDGKPKDPVTIVSVVER